VRNGEKESLRVLRNCGRLQILTSVRMQSIAWKNSSTFQPPLLIAICKSAPFALSVHIGALPQQQLHHLQGGPVLPSSSAQDASAIVVNSTPSWQGWPTPCRDVEQPADRLLAVEMSRHATWPVKLKRPGLNRGARWRRRRGRIRPLDGDAVAPRPGFIFIPPSMYVVAIGSTPVPQSHFYASHVREAFLLLDSGKRRAVLWCTSRLALSCAQACRALCRSKLSVGRMRAYPPTGRYGHKPAPPSNC